jgi:hypothetical protein
MFSCPVEKAELSLALTLRVEANVLKEEALAVLQAVDLSLSLSTDAVLGDLDILAEELQRSHAMSLQVQIFSSGGMTHVLLQLKESEAQMSVTKYI